MAKRPILSMAVLIILALALSGGFPKILSENGGYHMSESGQAIVDYLGCEYEHYVNESPQKVIARYVDLKKEGQKQGFVPLIISVSDVLVEPLQFAVEEESAGAMQYREAVIREAADIDAAALLSERYNSYLEDFDGESLIGAFESMSPVSGINPIWEDEVIIAKIPTQNPWELAAWVPMGGFNECPSPAQQVAIFRYWYEKYHAVPTTVTYDMWEMQVTAPPANNEDAYELAKEQFAFCSDLVLQGFDSVKALASMLKDSGTWQFWWD